MADSVPAALGPLRRQLADENRVTPPGWPVRFSAEKAASSRPRYRRAATGAFPAPGGRPHWGASHPGWLGSFQTDQKLTRGSRGAGPRRD